MKELHKAVLTGNESIARGFYEAGGLVASSYPGSPTVEILESMKQYSDIEASFTTNEKVAFETAIGASFAGVRTLVSMKHVGLNIAADPLMTFTQMPTRGGFVFVSGDDPGMHSSQNEQDNRNFAKFANMPVLVPGNSQEAKDYTKMALEISENYHMPVMVQITSRVCHSRCIVQLEERRENLGEPFPNDIANYAMMPPNNFIKQYVMKERLEELAAGPEPGVLNQLEEQEGARTLLITTGLAHYNLKELGELGEPVSILKLGLAYPLPKEWLREVTARYEKVLVVEEMTAFIENELKLMGIPCQGKEYFPFTGELHSEIIEEGLLQAGLMKERQLTRMDKMKALPVTPRPPLFCAGCPHRPVFDILKKAKAKVINDIGCYSMGMFPPFYASEALVSMGATLGISIGMLKANRLAKRPEPMVSVIGDGTFFHSGMQGMAAMLDELKPEDNLTVLILDNGTTAMTGGQENASSGKRMAMQKTSVDIPALLKAMGIENVQVVDQFKYEEASDTIKEAMKTPGLSVIITTRPCALHFRIKEPVFKVDPAICIGCRTCIKTNCPPLRMKKYEGIDKLKSSIDPTMCVGCSICAQVCPVDAISRPVDKKKQEQAEGKEVSQ